VINSRLLREIQRNEKGGFMAKPRVVILGGGFGGLAAAAILGVLGAGTGLVRAFTLPPLSAAPRVSSLAAPAQRPSPSPRILAAADQEQRAV